MSSESKTNTYSQKVFSHTIRIVESLGAIKNAPGVRYFFMHGKQLSASTRAGIFDNKASTWLLRFDNPHKGAKFPHININYKVTGVRDPHVKIPAGAVKAGETISKTAQAVGNIAFFTAIVIDNVRIFNSWKDDYAESKSLVPGKNVARTTTSVASTWTGGMYGASVGNVTFATVGGVIGFAFGPIGSAVGSSVFGIVGTVVGGVAGAYASNNVGKYVFNHYFPEEKNGKKK